MSDDNHNDHAKKILENVKRSIAPTALAAGLYLTQQNASRVPAMYGDAANVTTDLQGIASHWVMPNCPPVENSNCQDRADSEKDMRDGYMKTLAADTTTLLEDGPAAIGVGSIGVGGVITASSVLALLAERKRKKELKNEGPDKG